MICGVKELIDPVSQDDSLMPPHPPPPTIDSPWFFTANMASTLSIENISYLYSTSQFIVWMWLPRIVGLLSHFKFTIRPRNNNSYLPLVKLVTDISKTETQTKCLPYVRSFENITTIRNIYLINSDCMVIENQGSPLHASRPSSSTCGLALPLSTPSLAPSPPWLQP